MNLEEQLRFYALTQCVIVGHDTDTYNTVKNIIESLTVNGRTLKMRFGGDVLDDWGDEDHMLQIAHYINVYGGEEKEMLSDLLLGKPYLTVLERIKDIQARTILDIENLPVIQFKNPDWYVSYLKTLMETKTTLEEQKMDLLFNASSKYLTNASVSAKIFIRDVRHLLGYRVNGMSSFKYVSDIFPTLFRYYRKDAQVVSFDMQPNSEDYRLAKYRIPNKIKREIWDLLMCADEETLIAEYKKNNKAWRNIWKQLLIHDAKKTEKAYPGYKRHREMISGKLVTPMSTVEEFWRKGDLLSAYKIESSNFELLVNGRLLAYLRYEVGDFVSSVEVISDVQDELVSGKMSTDLSGLTIKSLLKLMTINPILENNVDYRIVYDAYVEYEEREFKPMRSDRWDLFQQMVLEVYKEKMSLTYRLKDKTFYVENDLDVPIPLGGKKDTSLSLDGHVSVGTKIEIPENTRFVRTGTAWQTIGGRGDVDSSTLALDGNDSLCYYGSPVIMHNGDTIVTSSGDWTYAEEYGSDTYSVELQDIDIHMAKRNKITKFVSVVTSYSGDALSNYHLIWSLCFYNEGERKVLEGGKSEKYNYSEYPFKTRLNGGTISHIPVVIDLEKMEITILNKVIPKGIASINAEPLVKYIKAYLMQRRKNVYYGDILKKAIPNQYLTSKEKADKVLHKNMDLSEYVGL